MRRSVATITPAPAAPATTTGDAAGQRRRGRGGSDAGRKHGGYAGARRRAAHHSSPEQRVVDGVAQAMDHQQVDLLDACGAVVRHAQMDVAVAEQSRRCGRRPCPSARRRACRARARPRSRRSRWRNCPTSRSRAARRPAPERAHLLREHLLERIVVGDRGQHRRVGGERDRRKLRPLALEAADHLGGEVLRIGRGAAVAAGEDLAVGEQAFGQHARRARDQRARARRRPPASVARCRRSARGCASTWIHDVAGVSEAIDCSAPTECRRSAGRCSAGRGADARSRAFGMLVARATRHPRPQIERGRA